MVGNIVTYMTKKGKRISIVEVSILLATHCFQQQYSKAEDIRFDRE